jgi:hypothetical protein
MQTPLLQFPHMYYFTSCAWDLKYRKTASKDVLTELAGLLYPDQRELVAQCFAALSESDADRAQLLANRLEGEMHADRLGRLGVFGRKLFPDSRIVADSLVLQLRLRGAADKLMTVSASTSKEECASRIRDCLDASIAWGNANGWPAYWGARKNPLESISAHTGYAELPRNLAACLKTKESVTTCFNDVSNELGKKYDANLVQQRGAKRLAERVLAMVGDEK